MIELHNINKAYGANTVLQHLEASFPENRCTVILGKSGCGKTTLLRLLAGLETPDSGTILRPEGLTLGMMFQEARLFPWLTCGENIALGMGNHYSSEELQSLLQMTGLTKAQDLYPGALSGGMQQRTSLARTLAMHSQMILMDEPFAALDPFTRTQMQQELLHLEEKVQIGTILVTHNIDEALTLGDRLLVLKNDRIAYSARLEEEKTARDLLSPVFIAEKRRLLTALE